MSSDDRLALDLLIRGFQVSRTIRLVADLGIADRIDPEGTATVGELASASGVEAQQLMRVLRALAAFKVFGIDAVGRAWHTPRSLLLRTDTPGSLHHSARFWTARGSWRAWEMLDAAMVGKVPHEVAWGAGRFDYLSRHPDEARLFDAFMANFPDNRHQAVADSYDFSAVRLIVDIGGGNGEALRRILARFPSVRGLVFDRPDVVDAIPEAQRAEGRLTVQGGNFLDDVLPSADCYMAMRVLHDWADADALRILRNCRRAMPDEARLLIAESLMPADPAQGRPTEYLVDIQMMAMFGGARERTEAEFRSLLSQAGFDLTRVVETRSPVSILEARPRA